jgi:2-desacetyl-2-hydroxyethyl bacteriochlorophyllide A dehydrogenase
MDQPRHARAVWFVAPRSVEVGECELPEPGPSALVVQTAFSGISPGTEMLAYRGEIDETIPLDESLGSMSGRFSYPFRYGYSCVGRVERSRAGVPEGALVFAFHPHQDRFVVPADEAVELESTEARPATLFPLVETALQVTLDAGEVADELVVVTGLGVVGVLSALLLQRHGRASVLASEPRAWRRQLAASVGVESIVPADLEDAVRDRTAGQGVALLVEVSGNPDALGSALPVLAHEGTALVASWYGTKPVTLPLGGDFHRRRLTIRSTQVSTIPARLADEWSRERRRAVTRDLMGELPLAALATHDFGFQEAEAAYRLLDEGADGLLHAALCYG